MLHSVNLLPWRDELRVERQRRLIVLLSLGVLFALSTIWLVGAYIESQLLAQQRRNQFLDNYALKLEEQMRHKSGVEQQYEALLTRISMVESLQNLRNQTTDFLNLLPHLIPSGVYVDKLTLSDHQVEIEGISESTSRLANMLANLESSESLARVEMHSIVHGVKRYSSTYQSYRVSFTLQGGDV